MSEIERQLFLIEKWSRIEFKWTDDIDFKLKMNPIPYTDLTNTRFSFMGTDFLFIFLNIVKYIYIFTYFTGPLGQSYLAGQ